MKILVTGSAGYIGALLCRVLHGLGHIVTEFDTKIAFSNDVQDIRNLKHIILNNEIQAVIHLASIRSIDECELSISDCININFIPSVAIYNLCQKFNIKFIFASTQATKNATNNYALCKLLAERNMPNAVILRLSNVVGSYAGIKKLSHYSLTDKVMLAIKNNQQIVLHGDCKRNFVFIEDVIDSFVRSLDATSGIYDCVGKINTPMTKWITAFEAYFSCAIDTVFKPKKFYDAEDLSVGSVFDEEYFYKIVESYGVV